MKPLREARIEFEAYYIACAMKLNDGNCAAAARMMQIQRTDLYRRLKRAGFKAPRTPRRASRTVADPYLRTFSIAGACL